MSPDVRQKAMNLTYIERKYSAAAGGVRADGKRLVIAVVVIASVVGAVIS